MPRHTLTPEELSRGGRATSLLPAAGPCPLCGRVYPRHVQLAGHLGLHSLANRYYGGDLQRAGMALGEMGMAAYDPAPWNGAWQSGRDERARIRHIKALQDF